MSSYSMNSMCISHKDSACIDRIVAAYNKGQLFSDYLPMPEEILRKKDEPTVIPLTHPGSRLFKHFKPLPEEIIKEFAGKEVTRPLWVVWCEEHWGTVRDVGANDVGNDLQRESANEVQIRIVTASAPPIPVFNHWVELGYDVFGSMDSDSGSFSLVYANGRVARVPERYEVGAEIDEMEE